MRGESLLRPPKMKIKTKKTVEVKLVFNLEELKILSDKLQEYIQLPLDSWVTNVNSGKEYEKGYYMTKSPTDEVEEFLMGLYLFFKNQK